MATIDDGNSGSRNQLDDRISDLPDSVLLHILSFLPTLQVVRTSVLSRAWQHMWTCVPSLDFDYDNLRHFKDGKDHVKFMNKFLFRYKGGSINKFRMNTVLDQVDNAEEWIEGAIDRNVEELDIRFPYYTQMSLQMPQTIFGCKTLVVLKLEGFEVNMAFPPKACIPCLKTLNLDVYRSPDENFENKLISCCVVLENLSIKRRNRVDRKIFRVNSQKLKRLEILFSYYSVKPKKDDGYVIDIIAPNLEDLDIKVGGSCSLLLANVGTLSKAKFSLNGIDALQSVLKGFSALKNVKSISLSSVYTQQDCNLVPRPTVHCVNLTHLTLGIDGVGIQLLPYFFRCFSNLEVLRLTKETSFVDYTARKQCIDPKPLPAGLLSRLRVFEAAEIRDTQNDLDMLKYILKNCEALDLVQIHNLRVHVFQVYRVFNKARTMEVKVQACEEERHLYELQVRVAQNIKSFPRASHKCQIQFPGLIF